MEPAGLEPTTSCLQRRSGARWVVSAGREWPIKQGFACPLVIAGGGCFPHLLDLCLVSPTKRRPPDQRRVHLPSVWLPLRSHTGGCPIPQPLRSEVVRDRSGSVRCHMPVRPGKYKHARLQPLPDHPRSGNVPSVDSYKEHDELVGYF